MLVFQINDVVTVYDVAGRDWTEEDETRRAMGGDWLAVDFVHRMGGLPLVIVEMMAPFILCRYIDAEETVVIDLRFVQIRRVPSQWWQHFCEKKPATQGRLTHRPGCSAEPV